MTVRRSALSLALLATTLFSGSASAFRVDYGDRTICTTFNECSEICYVNSRGYETCETVCDTVEICYDSPHEEIDDSDVVCDFDDPDFFRCIGVIR